MDADLVTDELSEKMRSLAEILVRTAGAQGVDWLDFSVESAGRLDDLIDEWWPPKPRLDDYESMIPAIGAYIGEILVRDTGATWVEAPEGEAGVELGGTLAFPLTKVAKRFANGRSHSIGHFTREIRAHWLSGRAELPATWNTTKPVRGKLRLPWRR